MHLSPPPEVDSRLEEQLVDGIVYAFQEQTSDDTTVMLNGFGSVVNALGVRVKPSAGVLLSGGLEDT